MTTHTVRSQPEAAPPELLVDPEELRAAVSTGRRLVILDDDPTGTQTVKDLPVLTRWAARDVRWAFDQHTPGFFVETNTRSLSPREAGARNRDIIKVVAAVAADRGSDFVVCSRGDSTLRGHFDVETAGLAIDIESASAHGVDAILVAPAYIEAGRVTIDSRHYASSGGRLVPVGETEYARDATFGYTQSNLPAWIAEVTQDRVQASQVEAISLATIRTGGPEAVRDVLSRARGQRYVVVDAISDADLQVVTLGVLRAEADGRRLLYRVGPSFVRARVGQAASPPLDQAAVDELCGARRPRGHEAHGLVVVGSHVPATTRQLAALLEVGSVVDIEVSAEEVARSSPADLASLVDRVAKQATEALGSAPVVIRTSRRVVVGRDPQESLAIARTISRMLVAAVTQILTHTRPAFVIAKGGITSSDVGTFGLGIRHAWVRGTALPGIVSIWEPVEGPAAGVPYVVFAGNVGGDADLLRVVETLEGARVHA